MYLDHQHFFSTLLVDDSGINIDLVTFALVEADLGFVQQEKATYLRTKCCKK